MASDLARLTVRELEILASCMDMADDEGLHALPRHIGVDEFDALRAEVEAEKSRRTSIGQS